MSRPTFSVATAPHPGAIGIIQLYGAGVGELLSSLTSRPAMRCACFLANLGDIDEGLVVSLRDDWAQLMPHGGPRVMQRLAERLKELGAEPLAEPPAHLVYPEASSELEADMLATLARAASPAAIDPLLDQSRVWCEWADQDRGFEPLIQESDPRDHLVSAPSVVIVGQPNVGKSTLTNLVLGRAASITADLHGTTRDWVAGLAELSTPLGGLAVRWIDTPGVRETPDPIERRAIELATNVIQGADVLIAVRDPETDWPPIHTRRQPDLWVLNKADLPHSEISNLKSEIRVSALTGQGLDELSLAVFNALGLDRISRTPWAFSDELRRIVLGRDLEALYRYTRRCPA